MTPEHVARIAAAIDADIIDIDGWRGVRPGRIKLYLELARAVVAEERESLAHAYIHENRSPIPAHNLWGAPREQRLAALAALAPESEEGV